MYTTNHRHIKLCSTPLAGDFLILELHLDCGLLVKADASFICGLD